WKLLHYQVYVLTGIILIHIALAAKGNHAYPFALMGVFLFAILLRIPPINRITIRSIPEWVCKLNGYLIQ
ncbi:MAG: hypothetical protein J7L66_04885, partial [Anaerolineaceae bacterium]|nr:hypothetical protein [Anaerolineaceae bacterium]